MNLPSLILISARENKYVLCITRNENNIWKFDVVNNPQETIIHKDGESGSEFQINILRESKRGSPKEYISTLKRTSDYAILNDLCIYVYNMTTPATILPSKYFKVIRGLDTEKRWHFVGLAPPAPAPAPAPAPLTTQSSPPSNSSIPRHILQLYINKMIQEGYECPITFEPITKETVVCTPCGHLFTKNGISQLLVKKCPTCRAEI